MASPRTRERLRLVLIVATLAVAMAFAVQGGEYSTVDLVRQQRQRAELRRAIDSLTRVVDSLRRYRQLVLTDPRTQERIAREEFGMVRGRELLYRFADPPATAPDSAGRRLDPR